MSEIKKITSENIYELKSLYEDFCSKAVSDFLFEMKPVDFEILKESVNEGFLKGYFIVSDDVAKGFLFYSDELNQAIEITLIHCDCDDKIELKRELLAVFLLDIKQNYHNKTISYPMLGVQEDFVCDITHFDFDLVGEMIVEFDFLKPVSHLILAKSETGQLDENYGVDTWKNIYLNNAVKTIQKRFSVVNDAKFDPRFKTISGVEEILNDILNNNYGQFLPEMTTVLLYKQVPVGYCFVNLTNNSTANIPILVLEKEHGKKMLGSFMIKNSVFNLKNAVASAKLSVQKINATCDTENYGAIRSYRTVGFKETTNYPHAYLEI